MKLMGRKKTLSLASSVALRVSRAVAAESFCCVRLKYCAEGTSQQGGNLATLSCTGILCYENLYGS